MMRNYLRITNDVDVCVVECSLTALAQWSPHWQLTMWRILARGITKIAVSLPFAMSSVACFKMSSISMSTGSDISVVATASPSSSSSSVAVSSHMPMSVGFRTGNEYSFDNSQRFVLCVSFHAG